MKEDHNNYFPKNKKNRFLFEDYLIFLRKFLFFIKSNSYFLFFSIFIPIIFMIITVSDLIGSQSDGAYIFFNFTLFSITWIFILNPVFILKLRSSNELKSMVNFGFEKRYFLFQFMLASSTIFLFISFIFLLPLYFIFLFFRGSGEDLSNNMEAFLKAKWFLIILLLILIGFFSASFGYFLGMKLKNKQIIYIIHILFFLIVFVYWAGPLSTKSFSNSINEVESNLWFLIHKLPLFIPIMPIFIVFPLLHDFLIVGKNTNSMYLIYSIGFIEMVFGILIVTFFNKKLFSISIKR